MIDLTGDVAILGSGFGGSLCAMMLHRRGMLPVLLDRGRHPRFAIGESSTPVADLVLRSLARDFDLPRVLPLAKYGTWLRTYPELMCGLKRGFTYFRHDPGERFAPDPKHRNELLVAASSDDERSDTHWLRADVDGFLAAEAAAMGIPVLDETRVTLSQEVRGWRLEGTRLGEPVVIRAPFLIDATGEAGVVLKHLGIRDRNDLLQTHSRGLFAHFAGLTPWRAHLLARGASLADHPFCCDDSALHQVFDEGWMWQLRFRNGVVSAGFAIESQEFPLDSEISIDQEWCDILARMPSLEEQFRPSTIVAPEGGLRRTGRLQRRAAQAVGMNWAALPNTAGFIDPLHSTGIGHTLCGLERLVPILSEHRSDPERRLAALQNYEATVFAELELIDLLVSGCYLGRRQFPLFAAFSMLYFAAATTYERRRLAAGSPQGAAFLGADDAPFCSIVRSLRDELHGLVRQGPATAGDIDRYEVRLRNAIAPYNSAGLCDPAVRNMYRFTVLPE